MALLWLSVLTFTGIATDTGRPPGPDGRNLRTLARALHQLLLVAAPGALFQSSITAFG
jgi:hypothetical protein